MEPEVESFHNYKILTPVQVNKLGLQSNIQTDAVKRRTHPCRTNLKPFDAHTHFALTADHAGANKAVPTGT